MQGDLRCRNASYYAFVPIKSPEEQAATMVLKARELLVRKRSQTTKAMRAHMAELGGVSASG